MSVPLRELGAYLSTMDWGEGVKTAVLMFECPNPRCKQSHSQGMPYSDEPFHVLPRPGGGEIKLWQRTAGSTIEDITMAPSFVVPSCDNLHGFVRAGRWEPC
jgi:hypothetical protein